MTIGERRVRTEFNPANSDLVDQLKQKSAELVDLCNEVYIQKTKAIQQTRIDENVDSNSERTWELEKYEADAYRLTKKAMESYELAAMWAVKAATTKTK